MDDNYTMAHVLNHRALTASLLPMMLMMCAAAPPKQGVEIQGGAGYDQFAYQTGGCGTTQYTNRARQVRVHGSLSYRSKSGFGATTDVNMAYAKVVSSEPAGSEEVDRDILLPGIVVRPSFHWKYIGIELGLGLGTTGILGGYEQNQFIPLISGRAWVGYPKYAYVWSDVLAGPLIPNGGVVLGLGHASDNLRLSAGFGPYASESMVLVQGQYQVLESIWLGTRLHTGINEEGFGAMLTFALTPEM